MPVTGPVLVHGTGSIGFRHLSVLRDRLGVATVAMPVRPTRSAELSEAGFAVAPSLDDAKRFRPERSIVATDTARHVNDAIELLQFGDVLVEKPVAPSAAEIAPLTAAAEARKRSVHVAFPFRFDEGLRALARVRDEIGAILSVRIECESFLPDWRPQRNYRESYSARANEGGVMRDLAHELDYAVFLFGRPQSVFCGVPDRRILGIDAEESADLWWEASDDIPVSVHLDYVSPVSRRMVRVVGERATVIWDVLDGSLTRADGKGAVSVERFPVDRDATNARMLSAFMSDDKSERVWLATLADGAFVAALTDAAHKSAESGRAEPIVDSAAQVTSGVASR